jgi:hypothetical protein
MLIIHDCEVLTLLRVVKVSKECNITLLVPAGDGPARVMNLLWDIKKGSHAA